MKTIRPWNSAIQRNLDRIAEMEATAIRVTSGPGGRCFVMPDGMLYTIVNEQPASSNVEHLMYVLPTTKEQAEDLYGLDPESGAEAEALLAKLLATSREGQGS